MCRERRRLHLRQLRRDVRVDRPLHGGDRASRPSSFSIHSSGGTPVDLTPRPAPEGATAKRRRRWLPSLVLVLVIGAGAVVVTQFLTSAIDYYCNVDEVGVKDGCDPGRRLRIQGVVDEGSVANDGVVTSFTVSFMGSFGWLFTRSLMMYLRPGNYDVPNPWFGSRWRRRAGTCRCSASRRSALPPARARGRRGRGRR